MERFDDHDLMSMRKCLENLGNWKPGGYDYRTFVV